MCGIIGFYSPSKNLKEVKLLKRLIKESSIRGIHSFGVAYTVNGKIAVVKRKRLVVDDLLYMYLGQGEERLIFHCRYSTSGDYKDMNNNQPILVRNTALVLNGIISMEEKKIFEERFRVKCKTANDAEIILRQKKNYMKFLKDYPAISFAGLFLKRNKIIAIRNNNRPMYYFTYRDAKYFVSTIDIAVRAGINLNKIESVPVMKRVTV